MNMKKSISIETLFTDLPFYDRFGKVREAGVDWVEFSKWTHLYFSRVTEELERNRLKLASIAGSDRHSLINPDQREDFLEFLAQSIAVAKSFNCGNLVIETGFDNSPKPLARASHDDFVKVSAATRTLEDAARKALRAGVTLYLKPVPQSRDPECIPFSGDVVKMVNSPALRLLLDTGSARELEGGAGGAMRRFRDLIGYVHIGARSDAGDLRRFRQVLAEVGYGGIVGFAYRADAGAGTEDIEIIRGF